MKDSAVNFHFEDGTSDVSKRSILDGTTLREIRKDIKNTFLPTWMERPPSNFGSISHGKLKADQWRVVCTVSLLITLVRLWGSSAKPLDQKVLQNFVHLVTAVDVANRRSMTKRRIELYYEQTYLYLRGLRELFEHSLSLLKFRALFYVESESNTPVTYLIHKSSKLRLLLSKTPHLTEPLA